MVYGMEIPINNNDVTKCSIDTIFGIMDFPFYENISSDSIFATTSIIAYDNMERNSNQTNNFHNSDYLEWSNDLKLSSTTSQINHKTFLDSSSDQNNIKFNNNNNNVNQLDNENIDSSNILENSNSNSNNDKYNNTSDVSNDDTNDTKVRMKITRKRKVNNSNEGDNIVQRKMQFFNHNSNDQQRDSNDNDPIVDPLATDETISKNSNTIGNDNQKSSEGNNTSRLSWQVNDITENLTADLDGSLSDLGADLTNGSYNMSDTLLQLPPLPVFKQEAPSPPNNNNNDTVQQNNNINNISGNNGHIQHIQQQQSSQQQSQQQQQQSPTSSSNNVNQGTSGGRIDSNNNQNNVNTSLHHLLHNYSGNIITNSIPSNNINQSNHDTYARSAVSSSDYAENNGFQYVLAAATSIATKINEDTLTYLNQGQSYEIKLKKLGDLSSFKGKTLKSVIGICFHERRMQYGGRERLSQWQSGRPGDRVLEVDVPLSYGLTGLQQPSLNTVAFNWDPTTPVGVYIKVNCISTEFTEKKHGGERGIPLRIQVETYDSSKSGQIPGLGKRLHAGACQIKVFKLKGADRKHKQDREKIMKRPLSEQEKYQPSYDCTVLNDISYDDIIPSLNEEPFSPPQPAISTTSGPRPNYLTNGLMPQSYVKDEEPAITTATNLSISPSCTNGVGIHSDNKQQTSNNRQIFNTNLSSSSSAEETNTWLITNRFQTYVNTFANFSGADILRLSRDDLIQICGLADGIRLYNALHAKNIAPKLILYVCTDRSNVFHAIYLTTYTNNELGEKLSSLIQASTDQIQGYFVQGPNGIHIHINDEVIRHFKNEAMYTVEIIANMNMNTCRILLKPLNP